eukprot:652794-Pleurochrysis_carterae.AAC.4
MAGEAAEVHAAQWARCGRRTRPQAAKVSARLQVGVLRSRSWTDRAAAPVSRGSTEKGACSEQRRSTLSSVCVRWRAKEQAQPPLLDRQRWQLE